MKAYHSQRLLEERDAATRARELPGRLPDLPAPPAKAPGTQGTAICIECAWHRWRFEWITGRTVHSCHHPFTRDVVTGAPTNPADNRRVTGRCGPGAKHWRAKDPAPTRPRAIEGVDDSEPMQFVPPVPVRFLSAPPRDEVLVELWPPA